MRIGVTGPREWTDVETVRQAFYELYEVYPYETFTLIEGEAEGFDKLTKSVAKSLGWTIEKHPVKSWYIDGKFSPIAGHMRNQRMVDTGADFWIAGIMQCRKPKCSNKSAHITHGTQDCIIRVKRAGIPIRELEPYDEE